MDVKTLPLGEIAANCYVITDADGVSVVVDPGAPSRRLAFAVENLRVKYILLTHGHFDHIMGAPLVKKLTGAPVLMHPLDAPMTESGRLSLADRYFPGGQEAFTPDILIGDGDVLDFAGGVQVYRTPGHTPGSLCFRMENMLFTGDTLFCGTVGRTDFPGGSMEEMLRSVNRLRALPGDYIVYPGHNRATTLQQEREQNRYLNQCLF